MIRNHRGLLAGLFLCVPVLAGAPREALLNPPQGLFSDEWMEVHFGDGKIGYAHSTMARKGDLIETRMTMNIRIGRADQAVTVAVTQETTETIDGRPRGFASETDMSIQKTKLRGIIENGKVTITSEQFGMEQRQEHEFKGDSIMTWGTYREGVLRGLARGTEYTLDVFAPDMRVDAPVKAITKVGDWEPFEFKGATRKGIRVTMTLETPSGSMEMLSWVNEDGMPLKAEMPVPGLGNLRMFATDQASALADFVPPEIFMSTTIKVAPIDTDAAQRITYRLRLKGEQKDELVLPETGMQKPGKVENGWREVVVTRQKHERKADAGGDAGAAGKSPDLVEYLSGNLMMNLADPQLVKLAADGAKGAVDPFVRADNLRRFVREHISDKSLDVGFATASEVCRTREGDCSEHGVLLAAVGRLSGLPSRVVVGIAYAPIFGGKRDIFGYHMWTEFYIDGQWYDFDAALGDERIPHPGRIAFATSSLHNAGLADLAIPLISKIGAVELEVVKVEP